MKYLLLLFFCSSYLTSVAQISGQVVDPEGAPIGYATVFNLRTKVGCVTDSAGFFNLNAAISDSIRIQHLCYKAADFILTTNHNKYLLIRSKNNLKEVVVSKNFAAWLAVRGYMNTRSRMQKETRERMYGCAAKLLNKDTLERISLDLDFERNKSGNGPLSAVHNRLIEIQRYCEQFNASLDTFSNHLVNLTFFPLKDLPGIRESQSREEAMNDNYIFQLSSDSLFFTIDFIPKKGAPPSGRIFEITLSKKDTCMIAFASATLRYPFQAAKSNDRSFKPETMDNAFFTRIAFENGQGYIANSYSVVHMYYAVGAQSYTNSYSVCLKNYAHRPEKLKKRLGVWMIDNQFGFNKKMKSRYSEEFWKYPGFPKGAPYDFDHLRNLRLK